VVEMVLILVILGVVVLVESVGTKASVEKAAVVVTTGRSGNNNLLTINGREIGTFRM
jgi:hypothetical protein